jgi:hypothetical protein
MRLDKIAWLALLPAFVQGACADATQVRVRLFTDVAHQEGTVVELWARGEDPLGDTAPSTRSEGPWSSDGVVGSLVVVPKPESRQGRLGLRAVLAIGQPTSDCVRNPSLCIVAERRLRFSESRGATVPIGLYRACLGVACGEGHPWGASSCTSSLSPRAARVASARCPWREVG